MTEPRFCTTQAARMMRPLRYALLGTALAGFVAATSAAPLAMPIPALDAAAADVRGWAADTAGGRGGAILRVTNLDASGPGSFAAAVATPGPRIVVFEVGGVIDLQGASIRVGQPNITIAGQTAPRPGITFIRGELGVATHDVIVQHIAVRPGEAGRPKKVAGKRTACPPALPPM